MPPAFPRYVNVHVILARTFKGELKAKVDFISFEYLGIVQQLYEVFLRC